MKQATPASTARAKQSAPASGSKQAPKAAPKKRTSKAVSKNADVEEGKDPGDGGKEESKKRRKLEGGKKDEEKKPKRKNARKDEEKCQDDEGCQDDEVQEAGKKKQKLKSKGNKKKKRAAEAREPPAEAAEASAAAEVHQNPPAADPLNHPRDDDDVVQCDVLPNSKTLRLNMLLTSMKQIHDEGLDDDEAVEHLKENLPDLKACRMNIYWSRAAVGLTCQAERKDFAYFRQGRKGCPNVVRLVAMLKAAEMVVACRHSIFL